MVAFEIGIYVACYGELQWFLSNATTWTIITILTQIFVLLSW